MRNADISQLDITIYYYLCDDLLEIEAKSFDGFFFKEAGPVFDKKPHVIPFFLYQ